VFELEYYDRLVGSLDWNGANIEAVPPPELRKRMVASFGCGEDELPRTEGNALFVVHSCLNHSCRPNAQVVGGLKDCLDARIKVEAIRPIVKGEEVTISYIDTRLPTEERRKTLKACYGFECRCQRCIEESTS
jgi:hypothetical protein